MRSRFLLALLFLVCNVATYAQSLTIVKGKVVDSKRSGIPNATVGLLNTSRMTNCDAQGGFEFNNLTAGQYTVVISAVGYATQTTTIRLPLDKGVEWIIPLAEESVELDAVVVTAEKSEENVQKVSLSITALPSKRVAQYRLWDTRELTALVPNLYSNNPGDGRNITSIRGIATTSYDPAVATYIDGVNQFSLDSYIPQLYDVERIEVLRGPQGTLYGRNAMGGVINIITKQSTNNPEGAMEASIGNYGMQRYVWTQRAPVINNKLFMGASLLLDKDKGYFTNKFNDSHFDKKESMGATVFMKYVASPRWQFLLNLKSIRNRNNGSFPLAGSIADALADPFELNQNAISKLVDKTTNSSLTISYNGPGYTLSSQTAYQTNYRYYDKPLDGDFSPIDGVTVVNNYGRKWNNVNVLTEEIKISSPAASTSKLKWTAGFFFFSQKAPNRQATHFGEDAALVGSPDKNYSIINTTHLTNTGLALYAQATYELSSRLDLTGGFRIDQQTSKESVLGEYEADANPGQLFPIRPDTSGMASYKAVSPMVRLSFHPSATVTVYVSYAKGFRTGGLTQLAVDPTQPPLYSYKPEYSGNYELGLKQLLFNNKARLNLSLFYTNITDAQVPTLVLPDAIIVTKNAGKLNSKGFDAELTANPVRNLELNYNFGYTDAKYSVLKISQNGVVADLKGNRQIFTPSYTSMFAFQYKVPVGKKTNKVVIGGEWKALGEMYFDLSNQLRQSPYTLLNLRAGMVLQSVEAFIWARNLGDTRYIAYAYDFGAAHLGAPRTYGVTLKVRY